MTFTKLALAGVAAGSVAFIGGAGSKPRSCSALLVSGSARILRISVARRSFTGAGVPAGTISTFQAVTLNSVSPCSAADLMSGSALIALLEVTASGFTLPNCARVAATVSISTGTWLPSTAVIASPEPL